MGGNGRVYINHYRPGAKKQFEITKHPDEKRVRIEETMNDKQMILVKKNSTDEYDLTPFTNHTQSYKIDIENLHGTLNLGDGRSIKDYEKKLKRGKIKLNHQIIAGKSREIQTIFL